MVFGLGSWLCFYGHGETLGLSRGKDQKPKTQDHTALLTDVIRQPYYPSDIGRSKISCMSFDPNVREKEERRSHAKTARLIRPLFIQANLRLAALVLLFSCTTPFKIVSVSAHEVTSAADMTSADNENGTEPAPFYESLTKALKKRKTRVETICPPSDVVARRILEDYGAMFLATKKVLPPPLCIFTNEEQVTRFQEEAGYTGLLIGYDEVELQPAAMKELVKAREEAQKETLDITPRDGAEAARRNYDDSVRLWNSRFFPALDYWLAQGRLKVEQVTSLRSLPLQQQVAEVLELEKNGIYFSKDLSKSILYSIAAPGTSQHIAMLAFDINEFENPRVREIMAKHGWFQTVLSDLPHFTFLGLKEKDLPKNGLRSVEVNGQTFWIPNVTPAAV